MATTPWISTLRDDPTNVLIVGDGDLVDLNPGEFGGGEIGAPEWFADFKPDGSWARRGEYVIGEVVGGDDVHGAASCAYGAHAAVGHSGSQLWNGSTTDADDSSPAVCAPVFDVLSGDALPGSASSYSLTYDDSISPIMTAVQHIRAWPIYVLKAREHLAERGVLSLAGLDPITDGVPADKADGAALEWEGDLELVGVEVTPDILGRPGLGERTTDGSTFMLNDLLCPTMTTNPQNWGIGTLPNDPDDTGRTNYLIEWVDGDPTWTTIDYIASWDDCQPIDGSALFPDISVGHAATGALGAVLEGDSGSNSDTLAVKLILRSPRYRWVYEGAPPVTRQYPRDDGRGISSAPRLYPPTKANRLAGGYS